MTCDHCGYEYNDHCDDCGGCPACYCQGKDREDCGFLCECEGEA